MTADQGIVPDATMQRVDATPPFELVGAAAAKQSVIAIVAIKTVVAVLAHQRVISIPAQQAILTDAAPKIVSTCGAPDRIIPAQAPDRPRISDINLNLVITVQRFGVDRVIDPNIRSRIFNFCLRKIGPSDP